MSSVTTGRDPLVREALYALSMAKRLPDAEVLDEVVREYPQFADELTDFAVEIALDVLRNSAAEAAEAAVEPGDVSSAVSRAISRFHNRRYALRRAAETTPTEGGLAWEPVDNPFEGLSHHELRALALRIGANTVFVIKLRDRQIEPESIPDPFKRRVCLALQITLELLVAHLAARPVSTGRQFFKADEKPTHGQRQSFLDAVRSSGLTEEAQRRLMSL